jgi:Rps23 Pro-64 3,4-dihydroxylase Tpa1-like proline 4-hydroxylase
MSPFPHWVIDGLLDAQVLRDVIAEWPSAADMEFKICKTSIKAHQSDRESFGPKTRALMDYLNAPKFIGIVEEITCIDSLIPDPELKGGGLHEIPPGGFLNMHVDFNWHPRLQAVRKLNLLLYLNEDWQWNGDLVLSRDGLERTEVIAPLFNRCVIFPTTESSWHGHPDPLVAPRSRRSIALYYYRAEPQPDRIHSTIYVQ